MRSWSERLDLVSPADLERFEERHIADSLRLLDLLPDVPDGPCADVGSGAGLPGVPLAICSPRRWCLLEPRVRRGAFLEEVVRELGLDCEVLVMTAQQAATGAELRASFALVTARAVAAPEASFELILPLVAAGGRAAVFHGPDAQLPQRAEAWRDGIATIEVPREPGPGRR